VSYPQARREFSIELWFWQAGPAAGREAAAGGSGATPTLTAGPKMRSNSGFPVPIPCRAVNCCLGVSGRKEYLLWRDAGLTSANCHWRRILTRRQTRFCILFCFKRDHHETYLPTFRRSSQAYARLPRTYGYPWWPPCPERAPRQGPQAPGSIRRQSVEIVTLGHASRRFTRLRARSSYR
jgi:hypothetical protein